jgi:hypothetical protein
MIDSTTHNPITVSTDGNAGPYLMVPLDQLDKVTTLLAHHDVLFWVDDDAISLDGKPEIAVVNLGRSTNVTHVQRVLDQAV